MQKLNNVGSAVLVVTGVDENPLAYLDSILDRLVEGASSTGDIIDDFATELCRIFNKGLLAWYDLKGKDAKPVNEYRTKFVERFEGVKKPDGSRKFETPTINSYWLRVKKASGKVTQAKVISEIINVRKLTLEGLMTTIRRVEKAEADDKNKFIDFHLVSDELDLLKDMFVRLGGHIDDKGNLTSPL